MSAGPRGITGRFDDMVELGWWRCERKKGYRTEAEALRVAINMALDGPDAESSKLNAYQCIDCGQWHVGKNREKHAR